MDLNDKGFFLCGARGIGKSTAIASILKNKTGYGFYVQRVICDGKRLGFTINRYRGGEYQVNADLSEANEAAMFIDFRKGSRDFNMDVYIEHFLEYTDNIPGGELCLLDEIGGLEFSDKRFVDRLYDLLDACLPVGVFKSDESFESFKGEKGYETAKCNRASFAEELKKLGILISVSREDLMNNSAEE